MTDPTQIHAPAPPTPKRPHYTFREKIGGWFQLVRLPMLLTAPGDSLAGAMFVCLLWAMDHRCGCYSQELAPKLTMASLWPLAVISLLFYTGGLILNDVADADRDAKNRENRPIPTGRIPKDHAVIAMFLCLAGAMLLSWLLLPFAAFRFAGGLLLCIILYDLYKEKSTVLACILMGLCRMGNFLLGAIAVAAGEGEITSRPAIEAPTADLIAFLTQWEFLLPTGLIFFYVAFVNAAARRESASATPEKKSWPQVIIGLLPLIPVTALLATTGSFCMLLILIGGLYTIPYSIVAMTLVTVLFLLTIYACFKLVNAKTPREVPPIIGLLLRNILLIQALLCLFGPVWLSPTLLGAWVIHWLLCRKFYAS